jgi:membrane protein required for colicin V production
MNWVDYTVLGVLAASGLLAFLRGFVREVLGIGAWIGAALVGYAALPISEPFAREWMTHKDLKDLVTPAAFAAVFILALVVLITLSHWIGGLVRNSVLGGLDRTLGLVFGLARGAVLVVLAYIVGGWLVQAERWPEPVLQARTLPLVAQGAAWVGGLAEFLPEKYRPYVPQPPVKETSAAQLMRAAAQGRATGPSPLAKRSAAE